IDQSSCNQDYSCVKGFCPSFVTVEGGTPRKSRAAKRETVPLALLPEPASAKLGETPYNILITGIGGTGVITIGPLLGMAAHQQPPGQFAQHPDWQFPAEEIRALIDESVGGRAHFIDATRLATALLGDSIATNLFMLGFAFQSGLIPLKQASILRAIELNAVS